MEGEIPDLVYLPNSGSNIKMGRPGKYLRHCVYLENHNPVMDYPLSYCFSSVSISDFLEAICILISWSIAPKTIYKSNVNTKLMKSSIKPYANKKSVNSTKNQQAEDKK